MANFLISGKGELKMMTAEQAKEKTKERLRVLAEEFILNKIGIPMQAAIDSGRFFCVVSFDGVPNPKVTGPEVVKILEKNGYKAEHIFIENQRDRENSIRIKWGDD